MSELSIGSIVQVPNRSGMYVGEIVEDRQDKYVVKILSVLKHPMQGDLHHPKQIENVLFHERKACALYEKINVLKEIAKPYEEEIVEYGKSLKAAVEKYRKQLESKDTEYNKAALKALKSVEESYYIGRYYE